MAQGLNEGRVKFSAKDPEKIIGNVQKFHDKREPDYPDWMTEGIEGPFVIKKDGIYYMFFSTWTRGYEVGTLKNDSFSRVMIFSS